MDTRPLEPHEELLTRAADGALAPAEREAFLSHPGASEALDALGALRADLRAAVVEPVDVADAVMRQLADDAAWSMGPALRDAVAAPPIDLADAVLAALAPASGDATDADIALSAYFDGALSPEATAAAAARADADPASRETLAAYAAIGEALRASTARNRDLWPPIAAGIGVAPDAVHGWEDVARPLRSAFAALPPVDVADAVLDAVAPPAARRMPPWVSLGGPVVAFALAASLLFSILPPVAVPSPAAPEGEASPAVEPPVQFAQVNDARIEELSAGKDVVVQVMQFEANGPTFILVDEPSGSGVPL